MARAVEVGGTSEPLRRGVHPEHVATLDRAGFQRVESFSYTVDVPFIHECWRGRVRTCNSVGSALEDAAVECLGRALTARPAREFPGDVLVLHRVLARIIHERPTSRPRLRAWRHPAHLTGNNPVYAALDALRAPEAPPGTTRKRLERRS